MPVGLYRIFVFSSPCVIYKQTERVYFSAQCTKGFTCSTSINNKETVENPSQSCLSSVPQTSS